MTAPNYESEYGGVESSIQPEPHQLKSHEEARLARRVRSTDPGDSVDAARERERIGDVQTGWM